MAESSRFYSLRKRKRTRKGRGGERVSNCTDVKRGNELRKCEDNHNHNKPLGRGGKPCAFTASADSKVRVRAQKERKQVGGGGRGGGSVVSHVVPGKRKNQ